MIKEEDVHTAQSYVCTFSLLAKSDCWVQDFVHGLTAGSEHFFSTDPGNTAMRVEWLGNPDKDNEHLIAKELCKKFAMDNEQEFNWLTLVIHAGCATKSYKLTSEPQY